MQNTVDRDKLNRMLRLYRFLVFTLICVTAAGCAQIQTGIEEISTRLKTPSSTARSETVTAGRLNLRKEPSTNSQVYTQLKKGDRVTIRSEEGQWVKVTTKSGRRGWVHSAYLTGFGAVSAGDTTLAQSDKDKQKKELPSDHQVNPYPHPNPSIRRNRHQ